MSILPFFYKSTGRGWFPGAKFKAAPREMRSTIARDVLFPWKMRQEIAETKLASVSYANRRKRSVSNGGRESLSRTSIRSVREKKIEKLLAKAARRDETKRPAQTRANAKYSRYPETVGNPVPVENLGAWIFLFFKLYFHFKIKLLSAKYFQFYRFLFLGLSLKILLKNANFFMNILNYTLEIYFVNFSIIIYYYLLIINKKIL